MMTNLRWGIVQLLWAIIVVLAMPTLLVKAAEQETDWQGKTAGERKVLTIKDVEYAFRWCPAGTFTMGSPSGEKVRGNNETPHQVTLTKGFWLLETEVTQEMWESVMGGNPSHFQGGKLPVEMVRWNDCQNFIEKLNSTSGAVPSGYNFSLPTEAQWEYACRAGTTTPFSFGSGQPNKHGRFADSTTPEEARLTFKTENKHERFRLDTTTALVGSYSANSWGLYDMHGNVMEWCSDWYEYYSNGPVTDPVFLGPSPRSDREWWLRGRVIRGGGHRCMVQMYCRSAYRHLNDPTYLDNDLGLRLVLVSDLCQPNPLAPTVSNDKVSLHDTLSQNGYAQKNAESLLQFLRYGDAASANAALRGDKYDRHEIMEKQRPMAEEIAKNTFFIRMPNACMDDNSDDIGKQRIKIFLPFYVDGFSRISPEIGIAGLSVGKIGISNANEHNLLFLINDKTLLGFDWWEAPAVERLNRVIYMMESPVTTLYVPLRGNYESIKHLARNFDEYQFEVTFNNLRLGKNEYWGAYKKDTLMSTLDRGGHSASLSRFGDPPDYFVTAMRDDVPEIMMCCLLSLKICHKGDHVVDSVSPREKVNSPVATPVVEKLTIGAGKKTGERKVLTIKGMEYAFRWCRAGTFWMGAPVSEEDRIKNSDGRRLTQLTPAAQFVQATLRMVGSNVEMPVTADDVIGDVLGLFTKHENRNNETQHQVKLTKGFWMLETEVTQAMWESVMGRNPSRFKGEKLPVEMVSWDDCQEFITKLNNSSASDFKFSLPTEAQWEYACRAGTTGASGGTGSLSGRGWYSDNSGGETHGVRQKKPNGWGLYDMHGNVWEWCSDWAGAYSSGPVTDPVGPSTGSLRVFRGGSWGSSAVYCRSAFRLGDEPSNRYSELGFRLALISE